MHEVLPFLFITNQGGVPTLQAVGGGRKPYLFQLERDFEYEHAGRKYRGAHVLRCASIEDFDQAQFDLVGRQTRWPMYFGFDVKEADGEKARASFEALSKERDALAKRVAALERSEANRESDVARLEEEILRLKNLPERIVPMLEPPEEQAPPQPEGQKETPQEPQGEEQPQTEGQKSTSPDGVQNPVINPEVPLPEAFTPPAAPAPEAPPAPPVDSTAPAELETPPPPAAAPKAAKPRK